MCRKTDASNDHRPPLDQQQPQPVTRARLRLFTPPTIVQAGADPVPPSRVAVRELGARDRGTIAARNPSLCARRRSDTISIRCSGLAISGCLTSIIHHALRLGDISAYSTVLSSGRKLGFHAGRTAPFTDIFKHDLKAQAGEATSTFSLGFLCSRNGSPAASLRCLDRVCRAIVDHEPGRLDPQPSPPAAFARDLLHPGGRLGAASAPHGGGTRQGCRSGRG